MNIQTNSTRPTNPPDPASTGMGKVFEVTRRAFLRGAAKGAAAGAVASVGVAQATADSLSPLELLEFSGPGRYLMRSGSSERVFYVERAPWMDYKTGGRSYKATAVNGGARRCYFTDAGFGDFAVKKLSDREALHD